MSTLRVEAHDTRESLRALEPEWRRLCEQAHRGLPFRLWEWQDAWWEHMRARQRSVADRLWVHSVRSADGELVAVAPFMLTHRPSVGPLRVRELQLFGADPNMTELRTITCRAGVEADVVRALRAHLRARSGEWDWMNWGSVVEGSEAEQVLAAEPGVRWVRETPDFVLPLAADWEQFKSGLKRNIKESLRKCYNAPRRDGLEPRLEVAATPAEVRVALEHFVRLHAARAQRDDTVRHRDVFASAEARRFLSDVCLRLAERGITRIFLLRLGDTVVAARVGFLLQDSLYLYYSGYDPAFSQYSVMTTAVAEALRWSIEQGLREVNLSTGEDVSKTRWGPACVRYREAFELSPSLRGSLAWGGYQRARAAVAHPKLGELAQRFLRRSAG
jgi:CelD/BcsL family acetyltransferase involved in cellulose biosynthesis